MTTFGSQHCLDAATGTTDQKLASTYYDGLKVYLDISDYTKDTAKWAPCVSANLNTYRGYVEGSSADGGGYGGVPGYWAFSAGLRLHYEKTGDVKSKNAVIQMAQHAAYCVDGTEPSYTDEPSLAREVGYCLNIRNDAEALGLARSSYHNFILNQALKHFDKWFVAKSFKVQGCDDCGGPGGPANGSYYIQPFMVAIEARAMLNENRIKPDARILPLVKAGLDYIWRRAWDTGTQAFFYENYAPTAEAPWVMSTQGAPDLNMLIAVAFWDYYRATGDTTYRTKADSIFNGGNAAYLEGQQKQFNQSYEWSVDMVRQRVP